VAIGVVAAVLLATFVLPGCNRRQPQVKPTAWVVDVEMFRTSARHWYGDREEAKVISPLPSQARYNPSDVASIADNIVLFQRRNGGWPKNYDMLAVLTECQRLAVLGSKGDTNTTFDNGATYSHVECLAEVFIRSGEPRYREACLRGIDFMLEAQYENGGWPQSFPDTSGYQRYITFNDGAMIGVMKLIHRIVRGDSAFAFVDESRRQRVSAALERGVECILRCQVVENGRRTAWCQQHDDSNFAPRGARSYEPPALAGVESAEIVEFLMDLEDPGQPVRDAIGGAVEWFERSAIRGIRVETVSAPRVTYEHHTSSEDRVVVMDPEAPPVWARYYELQSNRPMFCNRDGGVVYTLAEVDRERRTGYQWYTEVPQAMLTAYRRWIDRAAGPTRPG